MILKKMLRNKHVTIGSWLSLTGLDSCEIMAKSGFDWIAIDMEHTAISSGHMVDLIRIIDLCGLPALVRVGANDPLLIKHALDAGATGVIVPMVNSREDAKKAVASAYYPTRGSRGVGISRAQGYGQDFEGYLKRAEQHTVVILQIEHKDAIDVLDEILSVDGVDGFIIGPYDLSASLGMPGNFQADSYLECMNKVCSAVRNSNVAGGVHVVQPDRNKIVRLVEEGYTFLAYGVDEVFLSNAVTSEARFVQGLKK